MRGVSSILSVLCNFKKLRSLAGKKMKLPIKFHEVIPTPLAIAGWVEDMLTTSTGAPFGNELSLWVHSVRGNFEKGHNC